MNRVAPHEFHAADKAVNALMQMSSDKEYAERRQDARRTCELLTAMCQPDPCDMSALYDIGRKKEDLQAA